MSRLALLLVFVSTLLNAEVKVQTKTKGEITCDKVEYSTGMLKVFPEKDNKFHIKVQIEDVISVDHQEPVQVKLLEKYFLEGKGNLIANDKGQKVLEENYHTGWGRKSAFYLIMAFIKNKEFHAAEKLLKQALNQLPGLNDKEDRLLLAIAQSYLNFERAKPKFILADLDKISVPQTALGKMFYYQLQGRVLEEDMKSTEAVIAYYKGIMFGVKSEERAQIQDRIEHIYKLQSDPRKLPDLNKI